MDLAGSFVPGMLVLSLAGGAINNTLSTQSAHTYTRSRGFLTPGLEFVSIIRYF